MRRPSYVGSNISHKIYIEIRHEISFLMNVSLIFFSLVRLHTNVSRSLRRLEKFIFQEWRFNNTRLLQLHESLSLEDQKLFTLDLRPLIWKDYFTDLIQGVRTYLHNESPKSLPKARSKHKM